MAGSIGMDAGGRRPDFFDRIDATPAGTRANALDVRPTLGRLDVLGPEGPGLALNRSSRVHGAAGLRIPEDAVPARPLGQTQSVSDLPQKLSAEFVDRLSAERREAGDLFLIHPH